MTSQALPTPHRETVHRQDRFVPAIARQFAYLAQAVAQNLAIRRVRSRRAIQRFSAIHRHPRDVVHCGTRTARSNDAPRECRLLADHVRQHVAIGHRLRFTAEVRKRRSDFIAFHGVIPVTLLSLIPEPKDREDLSRHFPIPDYVENIAQLLESALSDEL